MPDQPANRFACGICDFHPRQIRNLNQTDKPLGFNYTLEAQGYAKNAGGLVLVRPRVLGIKTSGLLETKEARKFPIESEVAFSRYRYVRHHTSRGMGG